MAFIKAYLMSPIFYLYKKNKIEDIKFDKQFSERIKDYDELIHRIGIYKTLQWAEKNPDYHFESVMEDAPVVDKLKFSNDEVYQYLMNFKAFMENEEFGLLTDDRPTNFPWEN